LPAGIAAEAAILGAILLNSGRCQESAGQIEAGDFSLDLHCRFFLRIGDCRLKAIESTL
jgi:replicative DNA helicase